MRLLRKIFLEDLGLKVTSLLLGFLLWFQVAGQETVQRSITVPIEFQNMPADLVISNDFTKEADVTIRRPASQPNPDSELAVRVDMSDSRLGPDVIPLTEANVQGVPFGVEVENVSPPRIRLEIEKIVYKSVAIEAVTTGQPAEGYQLSEVRLTPSEVLIRGPESRVDAVVVARTAGIPIGGHSQPFTTRFSIDLKDETLRIEDTAMAYEALVVIEEERRRVVLGSFRVAVAPEGRRARIAPRSVRLTGSVPVSFEGELDPADFSVLVRIPEDSDPLEAGATLELTPEVVIPEEAQGVFRVVAIEPEVVTVTLR